MRCVRDFAALSPIYAATLAPTKGRVILTRDTLNGTAADATFSSDLQHTLTGWQLILDLLFQGWVCRSRFLCRPRKPGSPPCELP